MTYQSVPHRCVKCGLTWLFVGDTCDVCRCLPSNTNLSPAKGTLGGGSIAGLDRQCVSCRRRWVKAPGSTCDECEASQAAFFGETNNGSTRGEGGMSEDIHTCHAECPCHSGGEPRQDFVPVESASVALMLTLGIPPAEVAELVMEARGRSA